MRKDPGTEAAGTDLPLRPAQLALLIYGLLIFFLELAVLLFYRRAAAGEGITGGLPVVLAPVHGLFALLLLVDAIRALSGGARRPARAAFETMLGFGVLWALQRSVELMALSF